MIDGFRVSIAFDQELLGEEWIDQESVEAAQSFVTSAVELLLWIAVVDETSKRMKEGCWPRSSWFPHSYLFSGNNNEQVQNSFQLRYMSLFGEDLLFHAKKACC